MDVDSREVLRKAWAKFFQDNDIAERKDDCPYFRAAMKITQELGPTPLPTAKEIGGMYLDKNYDEATQWLKLFKQDWKNYGVTLMCDSWTSPTEFLYKEIKKVIDQEIGHENMVQIVTDNGSNYKKACKTLVEEPEYNHIVWQPCATHTVNLMLKDLAKFPHIDVIIKSAKRICRFFHNHNNLHDSMKKMKWMVSDNWKESVYKNEADYVFAEELLSSNMWWSALEWVLEFLEPLYRSLRYADTQKRCTLSGFKKNIMSAVNEIRAHLGEGSEMCHRVMSKVSKRIEAMQNDTLMIAAVVLDPHTHYQINMSKIPEYATALTDAIQKIADPDSVVLVFNEISTYRESEWWFQFGEVPNLQKYALRIVSQCVSSSGCERNCSAFALVQTRQRNRLLYGKMHKCVSVRHNLKICAEEDQDPVRENAKEKEVDPSAIMLDTTMFDETNPMMEWLNEDEERVILDGAVAATAVFERIRSLNSSKKASHLGRKDNSRKRKRVVEEEDEYTDFDDEEEDEYDDIDIDGQDDSASESGGGEPSCGIPQNHY
uniref:Uncharacterized protein n=1 Tax=Avena sativa TaxID=4498 RepID=A0ACD5VHE5_AVESA